MEYYRKRVEFYFESEFSDFPLDHWVEQIRFRYVGEKQSDVRARWNRKIQEIVRAYYRANKPPSDAAQKLAKLLTTYTGRSLLNELI